MDRKSKIFFLIFFLLIIGSVSVTYYKYIITKNYIVEGQIDCDPTTEKCFIWKCNPEATDESEKCTGNPDKDIWYYKLAERKASQIPLCDPAKDENCDPWTCGEGEKNCMTTFCDDTTKEKQGVECSDPAQYNIDHPEEETSSDSSDDTAVCAPDNQACADSGVSTDSSSSE